MARLSHTMTIKDLAGRKGNLQVSTEQAATNLAAAMKALRLAGTLGRRRRPIRLPIVVAFSGKTTKQTQKFPWVDPSGTKSG